MSYCKVVAVGNLGSDAELRYTQGGTAVSNFSVATSERWKDKDGNRQERTEWVRVVLWGPQAETLKDYLVKGKQVLVEGGLQTRKWQDRDGNDKYTTEVRAHRVVLLGGGQRREERRDAGGFSDDSPAMEGEMARPEPIAEDDIPF